MMLDAAGSGLADPVLDAQAHFRALMDAFAGPGRLLPFVPRLTPPAGLPAELAAAVLTLADHETTVWFDAALAARAPVAEWLAFHAGARLAADPAEAGFAVVTDVAAMPPLAAFAQGNDAYPDRSTTLLIAVDALAEEGALVLSGPGVDGERRLGVTPWPAGLTGQLGENRARFPRGVDLLFAAAGRIAALPRSTRIREG